jgi:hypothetical protein
MRRRKTQLTTVWNRKMHEFASVRGAAALDNLLTELARALLLRGMTAVAFTELARRAFVSAAAVTATFANGKANCSRIAARTGLSRAEVRKLLGSDTLDLARLYPAPLDQVIGGWCNDRQFTDRAGRPKSLKISGPGSSFAALTRMYAGDLPHRAVLEELRAMGAVRVVGSAVSCFPRTRSNRKNLMFLASVVRVLQLNSSRNERAALSKNRVKRASRMSS